MQQRDFTFSTEVMNTDRPIRIKIISPVTRCSRMPKNLGCSPGAFRFHFLWLHDLLTALLQPQTTEGPWQSTPPAWHRPRAGPGSRSFLKRGTTRVSVSTYCSFRFKVCTTHKERGNSCSPPPTQRNNSGRASASYLQLVLLFCWWSPLWSADPWRWGWCRAEPEWRLLIRSTKGSFPVGLRIQPLFLSVGYKNIEKFKGRKKSLLTAQTVSTLKKCQGVGKNWTLDSVVNYLQRRSWGLSCPRGRSLCTWLSHLLHSEVESMSSLDLGTRPQWPCDPASWPGRTFAAAFLASWSPGLSSE